MEGGNQLVTLTGSYNLAIYDLLHCIDILVDGRFLREEKDISLQFRGSRNQRIIDLPRTLSSDRIVLWDQLRR